MGREVLTHSALQERIVPHPDAAPAVHVHQIRILVHVIVPVRILRQHRAELIQIVSRGLIGDEAPAGKEADPLPDPNLREPPDDLEYGKGLSIHPITQNPVLSVWAITPVFLVIAFRE